jgi:hypothetical protein
VDQGPIKAFYLAGDVAMATLMRATRLFVAVATIAIPSAGAFAGGPSTPVTPSVGSPSQARVEFTRPGGIPGSARSIAVSEQYLLAPAQPSDPAAPKRRKKP